MMGNLGYRVSRAVVIFAMAVVVSVVPGLMAGTSNAAKTYRVIYPAGLDMEKAAMLAGWDLFLKDIKVEPVILKGQGSVARAVLSGKEHLGYLTFSVFAKALAKGGKLVALAVSEQHLVWGIVAKNKVNSVKDLKGKRFAVHAPGGISASFIDYYATKVGYKRKDFEMYYIRGVRTGWRPCSLAESTLR